MKEKRKNLMPVLLSLLVMLLWGSLFPLVKLGYEEFQIDTKFYPNLLFFAGVRFTVSGLLITAFQGIRKKTFPVLKGGKEWTGVLLVGVFAVIFHYACTYFGLSVVESSKTALLKQSGVLVFIFFSSIFIKEDKLSVEKGLGAVLGIASIIVLNINDIGFSIGLGELFVILASCCTVISNVVCKKMLKNTDATVMTGYSELFGGIILLVVGWALGGGFVLDNIGAWCLFVYIIIATCISYILWYSIVQKHELSKLFIIKLSEPLFAAIIASIILKEDLFQLHYLLAFLCVGLAVVVSNLSFRQMFKNKKKNAKQIRFEDSDADGTDKHRAN